MHCYPPRRARPGQAGAGRGGAGGGGALSRPALRSALIQLNGKLGLTTRAQLLPQTRRILFLQNYLPGRKGHFSGSTAISMEITMRFIRKKHTVFIARSHYCNANLVEVDSMISLARSVCTLKPLMLVLVVPPTSIFWTGNFPFQKRIRKSGNV